MFMLGYIHTNVESYIFNFGNNLLWLKYLKTVNQLPPKTLDQTLYNMNKGKIRQGNTNKSQLVAIC